jgi:signal transduction histidine kinase/CheY-like chemotaxis protein/HPt (histidine-containing phosphotransfer) domain-containing protein
LRVLKSMRVSTKLFLTSAAAVLLLWMGAFALIQNVVRLQIEQMAHEAFEGTKQSLASMQAARVDRMRQAGRLVMNIPELRALIAEQSSELTDANRASLKERLDYLRGVLGASFLCVLGNHAEVTAQSTGSPWTTVDQANAYCRATLQPAALIHHVFAGAGGNVSAAADSGLWPCGDHIYQVVAIPLIFDSDDGAALSRPDGAIILAAQIDDAAAAELALAHHAQVTFLMDGNAAASSLPIPARNQLVDLYRVNRWPASTAFVFQFQGAKLHGSIQDLIDSSSQTVVAQMLIQRDQQEDAVQRKLLESLVLIMATGVLLAGIGSFVISAAITRPVQDLVSGARKVADGDLDFSLPVTRRDELGQLATSFNNMVSQLRTREELIRQVAHAQSASRAKSQFLANMSHEIRTPLNGVIGMTELLLGTKLSEQQRHFVSLAKSSGQLLGSLIDDILDLSKIEAGKLEMECIDFDLYACTEEVVELLTERAARKNLDLACHFDRDVPRRANGDPGRLRQILVNLINNAIKFTSTGSVSVSVTREADLVRFAITDTGIGIPPDRMDRLFKPFSQVDASTTRQFGGTGLGLAIAKQLAELMGGAIGVQSLPGQGATFWFTIKLPNMAPPPPSNAGLEQISVLVADDMPARRDLLLRQLTTCGFSAALAESGRPCRIVLINTDSSLATTFKNSHGAKLIALLPFEAAPSPEQLAAAGFSGFINRPVRQSQLAERLLRVVTGDQPSAAREQTAAPVTGRGNILVAEDNEVNQIVVKELLAAAGYGCHVVGTGRMAVDAVFAGQFDAVLMDCQMPDLDGLEATRTIRRTEAAERRPRLPIIALTANASNSDRQQCLDAGMDEYCSKPVDAQKLLTILSLFLKKDGLPPISIDALLEQCSHNAAVISRVIDKFEQQARHDIEQLQTCVAAGDGPQAASLAHALKGAASIVGASPVATAAAALEQLARDARLSELEPALAQLRREIDRCIAALPGVRAAAEAKP